LLIHVADVRTVLAEMARVTRPGGIVVAAEPNNAVNHEFSEGLAAGLSLADIMRLLHFNLTIFRGKAALGLGDLTLGRVLPGVFQAVGLQEISVCLNEKTCPMIPPYTSPRERAYLEELKDWVKRDFFGWSREDAERYFVAGGGAEKDFADLAELELELRRRLVQSAAANTYVSAGGSMVYLVAGRKGPETGR
jgi:SAM-dependent methyltransferase